MWYQEINHPQRKKTNYKCPVCGKEQPWRRCCADCLVERREEVRAHEEKLEKRRKYKQGNPIKSIDEIFKQNLVYCGDKIMSIGFLVSMPCQTVHHMVHGNYVRYAIKKEE